MNENKNITRLDKMVLLPTPRSRDGNCGNSIKGIIHNFERGYLDGTIAMLPMSQAGNPGNGPPARLLCNGSSKKGPNTWALSIAMPGGRCPFSSDICARSCYANVGKFPLNRRIYERNYQATQEEGFAERMRDEITALAWREAGKRIAICIHEKGELYRAEYVRQWGQIIRELRPFPNVSFFMYTRSWISEAFRTELDMIASRNSNVRINLSLDREMVERHGVPQRVGDGLMVYLAETDDDLPPAGVDLVVRNLRIKNHAPMERIGDTLVCPNESGLYVAKEHELPVVKDGKTVRIRCQDCRLCIDRGLAQWEQVKAGYAGTPGMANPNYELSSKSHLGRLAAAGCGTIAYIEK